MLQPAVFHAIHLFEQEARRSVGQIPRGLSDRGQRGPDKLRQRRVVEACDRQIFGEAEAFRVGDRQDPCRHVVVAGEDRGRASWVAQQ